MAIYLGNGHTLVTAMLGKTTKVVRVYFSGKRVSLKKTVFIRENLSFFSLKRKLNFS